MIKPQYRAQVELLLDILPYVAKEKCFALKGGTAINMFVWNMPRLSVDIDLTYINFEDRDLALTKISESLLRIKIDINKNLPSIQVDELGITKNNIDKITCSRNGTKIKVEVNTTMRGIINSVQKLPTNKYVKTEFGKFASIQVQSEGELFGGKICAALDRQHPRDLFDMHHFFGIGKITREITNGFIVALLSHDKAIHVVLNPNLQDQRQAFERQFYGMTYEKFEYTDYETTRNKLIKEIRNVLTDNDKKLLLSVKSGEPDWNLSPITKLKDLPAIKWKLQNILKLKSENPQRHQELLKELERALSV